MSPASLQGQRHGLFCARPGQGAGQARTVSSTPSHPSALLEVAMENRSLDHWGLLNVVQTKRATCMCELANAHSRLDFSVYRIVLCPFAHEYDHRIGEVRVAAIPEDVNIARLWAAK